MTHDIRHRITYDVMACNCELLCLNNVLFWDFVAVSLGSLALQPKLISFLPNKVEHMPINSQRNMGKLAVVNQTRARQHNAS